MNDPGESLKVYRHHAELYDYLYGGGGNDYLDFLFWIFERLEISKIEKILDMGSGTGRLLIPLSKNGYNVKGLEPFEGMRNVSLSKAKEQGVEIDVADGSFQTLTDKIHYSLIYSMDGTMAYLKSTNEYRDSFKRIASALQRNGYFLMDVMNFYSLIKNYKYPDVQKFTIDDSTITALVHHEIDFSNELWIHKSTVVIETGGEIQKIEDTHTLNMISRKLLIELGLQAGLKVELILNNVKDRPDERIGGSRNIILFRKAEF